jgi:hypothetical protein
VAEPSKEGYGPKWAAFAKGGGKEEEEKKSNIFLDVTLCSHVEVHRRFREKNCLHLQGRRVREGISRRQLEKP